MRFLLISLAALAACSPPPPAEEAPEADVAAEAQSLDVWAAARAEGVDFRAIGQEPGWLLNIYRENRITLDWDYGQSKAEFPLSPPRYPQEGVTRYETLTDAHRLTITIRRGPCQDVMSGEDFPAVVEIMIDERPFRGCGRSV